MKICGTSATTCPDDPDGVTSGMAVQTKPSPFGGCCYILGQYDDSVTTSNWSPFTGPPAGVALTLANGAPSDCPQGTPRQLSLKFECGSARFCALPEQNTIQYPFAGMVVPTKLQSIG